MTLRTSRQDLGGASVEVEYEYEPGEREEGPESRAAGPGYAASVTVTRVNICNANGYGSMVGSEHFDAGQLSRWEANILLEHQE